jgi:ppGpp synthetase/RelA/SpoT-type nucleotidyltranferase
MEKKLETLAKASELSLTCELRKHLPREGAEARVEWRIKSRPSIDRKLERRRSQGRSDTFVNDLLGFRIIVSHVGLVEQAVITIKEWIMCSGALDLVEIRNYFESPVSELYRSVHLDTRIVAADCTEIATFSGVEFQVTSYLQNFVASISHDLFYIKHDSEGDPEAVKMLMRRVFRNLVEVDVDVADAFKVLSK